MHITLTLTGQVSTGGVLSVTVTVAVQSSDRPPGSVQVSVTVVFPSANGPAGESTHVMASPSGSDESASTWSAVTTPWHDALAGTVTF